MQLPARREHSHGFGESGDGIGEELQALLAQHTIEAVVIERLCIGRRLEPFDLGVLFGRNGSGNGQHRRVEIGTDHAAAGRHDWPGVAGDQACSTCQVEHGVAGLQP